ncbi:hypothetical protein WJX77_011797 [Trebouxia sp. C0004]
MAQPTDKQSVVELEAEVDKGPQTPALQKQQIAVGSKRSAYGSTGRSFSKRPASQAPTSTAILCRQNAKLFNDMVVPYNPALLLKFNCHINVEVVSTIKAIKHL